MKTKNLLPFQCIMVLLICIAPIIAFSQWSCGDDLTDARDGRIYTTVQIDNQCWMAENLNYGTMIASSQAGAIMLDNGIIEKYCWNNDSSWCNGTGGNPKYGGFYEWQEAMNYYAGQPTLPVQGLCPTGWHIPERSEYESLITYLGGSAVAGGKMKVGGSSGFEGILTGYRCTMNGGFLNSPTSSVLIAYYWSSEQSDASNAYFYELNETNSAFSNGVYSPFYKSLGLSIRCLKDGGSSSINEQDDNTGFDIRVNEHGNGYLGISLFTELSGSVIIEMYDLTGRRLLEEHVSASKGENNLQINNLDISRGTYIFKVQNDKNNITRKIYIP